MEIHIQITKWRDLDQKLANGDTYIQFTKWRYLDHKLANGESDISIGDIRYIFKAQKGDIWGINKMDIHTYIYGAPNSYIWDTHSQIRIYTWSTK